MWRGSLKGEKSAVEVPALWAVLAVTLSVLVVAARPVVAVPNITLEGCTPRSSPLRAGPRIICLGSGFNGSEAGTSRSKCAFHYSSSISMGSNLLSTELEVYDHGTRIECVVPDLSGFIVGAGFSSSGVGKVRITGVQSKNSNAANFTLFDLTTIHVHRIVPGVVTTNDTSVIAVEGRNFPDTGEIVCRLDNVSIPARFVNASRVECTVPLVGASYLTRIDLWLNNDTSGFVSNTDSVATRLVYIYTAPVLTEIRFLDSYAVLEVLFDRACEIGGENVSQYAGGLGVNCSLIFSPASLNLVGAGSMCRWTSQEQIAVNVFLSPSTQVSVNDQLTISPTAGGVGVRSRFQQYSRLAVATTTVQPASAAATPMPVIVIRGPLVVPACGLSTLDASISRGGGGRPLQFSWQVSVSSLDSVEGGTTPLLTSSNSTVSLDSAWLSATSNPQFRVGLNATNFASESQIAVRYPTVASSRQAAIVTLGTSSFRSDRAAVLEARLSRQTCASALLRFTPLWNSTSSSFLSSLTSTSATVSLVRTSSLAGDTFPVVVTVTSRFQGSAAVNASTVPRPSSDVTLAPSPIQASVGGGVKRTVSGSAAFVLDACSSSDPDQRQRQQSATFQWNCTTRQTGSLCGAAALVPSSNRCQLDIPAASFPSNRSYVWSVTVTKGNRSSSARAEVTVVAESAPVVHALSPLYRTTLSVNQHIAVSGFVTATGPVNVSWRCVNNITGYGYVDVVRNSAALLASQSHYSLLAQHSSNSSPDGTVSASAQSPVSGSPSQNRRKFSLVLRPGVLTPGLTYQFRLLAGAGSADVAISTGFAPFGGHLIVVTSPTAPTALVTPVSLRTEGWSDSPGSYPLLYRFGVQLAGSAGIHWWSPAQNFNGFKAVLPLSINVGSPTNQMVLWVEVENAHGSTGRASAAITVARPSDTSASGLSALLAQRLASDRQSLDRLHDWAGTGANIRSLLLSNLSVMTSTHRDVLVQMLLDIGTRHVPPLKPYQTWLMSLLAQSGLNVCSQPVRFAAHDYATATALPSILQPVWLSAALFDPLQLRNTFGLQQHRYLSSAEACSFLTAFISTTESLASLPTPNAGSLLPFLRQLGAAVARGLAIHQQPVTMRSPPDATTSRPGAGLRVSVATPPTADYGAVCSPGANCQALYGLQATLRFPVTVATHFESYTCGGAGGPARQCYGVAMVTGQFESPPLQMPVLYSSPARSDAVLVSLQAPNTDFNTATAAAAGVELGMTIRFNTSLYTTRAMSSAGCRIQCQRYLESTLRWTTDDCTISEEDTSVPVNAVGKLWTCSCSSPTSGAVVGLFERCPEGYYGDQCNIQCPANSLYGYECQGVCTCVTGQGDCNATNGRCACHNGWQGTTCAQPCNTNFYGGGCQSPCRCQNGATCDHITGSCACTAGWKGVLCDTACETGRYGDGCRLDCSSVCQNGADCHHVTISCNCTDGYMGLTCDTRCNGTAFGRYCVNPCPCDSVGSVSCHHVNGSCTCVEGFTGETCAVPPPVPPPASLVWVVAVVVVLLLIVVVVLLVWFLHRRREQQRKRRVGAIIHNDTTANAGQQGFARRVVRRLFQRSDGEQKEEVDGMSGHESEIEITRTVSRHERLEVVPAAGAVDDRIGSPDASDGKTLLDDDDEDEDDESDKTSADDKDINLNETSSAEGHDYRSRPVTSAASAAVTTRRKSGAKSEDDLSKASHITGETSDGTEDDDDESFDDRSDNPDYCVCGQEGEFECECTRQAYCSEDCQHADWTRHVRYCTLVDSDVSESDVLEEETDDQEEGDGDDEVDMGEPILKRDTGYDVARATARDLAPKGSDADAPTARTVRRTMSESTQPTTMTLFVDKKMSQASQKSFKSMQSSAGDMSGKLSTCTEADSVNAAAADHSAEEAWRKSEEARKSAASISASKKPADSGFLKPPGAADDNPLVSRSFHASDADAAGRSANAGDGVEIADISDDDLDEQNHGELV